MPPPTHPFRLDNSGPPALKQSRGFLCRGLCRNPSIPTRIETCRSLPLGYR